MEADHHTEDHLMEADLLMADIHHMEDHLIMEIMVITVTTITTIIHIMEGIGLGSGVVL
jgi:hypothetical protein